MTLGLESWTDEDLRALLELRRDLAVPAPPTFSALDFRTSGYTSIRRAEAHLDRFQAAVLHTCCLVLTDRPPAAFTADQVRAALGSADVDTAAVVEALEALRSRALVVSEGSGYGVPAGVRAALPRPAGLGPSARAHFTKQARPFVERVSVLLGLVDAKGAAKGDKAGAVERALAAIRDTGRVTEALEHAPDQTRAIFDKMVHDGSVIQDSQMYWNVRQPSHPVGWLYERGLVVHSSQHLEPPREVALAFRGGVPFPGLSLAPPALDLDGVDDAAVTAAGVAAANDAVAVVERLVAEWATRPATLLKTGGIGMRELKRPAKAAGLDEATAAMVAELAYAAGLVALDEGEVRATVTYDEWRMAAPGARWLALAEGWRTAPRWPSMSGRRVVQPHDGKAKVIPALDPAGAPDLPGLQRDVVLGVLASAPPGTAPTAASVLAQARWRGPGLLAEGPAEADALVALVLTEAEFLGCTGHGALTPLMRALLAGGAEAARPLLDDAFGHPSTEVTLQADLTAVVVGVADPALRAVLDDAADVESRGAATVWRFREATVRRALDRGRSAEELASFLATHATRALPQPLAYLIADVGRRHGEIRVGRVASYLRSDDEGLLARVVSAKRAGPLGLRRVAPTVAVSSAEPSELLAWLRDEGLAPVEEGTDGAVVAVVDGGVRAAAPPAWARSTPPGADEIVVALRQRQQPAPVLAPQLRPELLERRMPAPRFELQAAETPKAIRALLVDAAATGEEVDLEWEAQAGRRRQFHGETVRIVTVTDDLVVAVGSDRRRLGFRILLEDITWASISEGTFHDGFGEFYR